MSVPVDTAPMTRPLVVDGAPMPDEMDQEAAVMRIKYDGQSYEVEPGTSFDIGREGDLSLDNNRYLHRHLLRVVFDRGLWWVVNVGSTIVATLYAPHQGVQAWLKPTVRLPLIFGEMEVVFTAGPCTYRVVFENPKPMWQETRPDVVEEGDSTVDTFRWTDSQRLAIVALAEPMLRGDHQGIVHIPSNVEAARRVGWTVHRFERKIDNICVKLDRLGIDGMRGGIREHAIGRRARLVEWAVSSGAVTTADLPLLDGASNLDDD